MTRVYTDIVNKSITELGGCALENGAILGLGCQFRWPCGLKGSFATACLPGSRVQIPNSTYECSSLVFVV